MQNDIKITLVYSFLSNIAIGYTTPRIIDDLPTTFDVPSVDNYIFFYNLLLYLIQEVETLNQKCLMYTT